MNKKMINKNLTELQKDILSYIKKYISENKIAPTQKEIYIYANKHRTTVRDNLYLMVRKGHIEIIKNKRRGIKIK
jgi:SOS-response transcriptional repressor LexA